MVIPLPPRFPEGAASRRGRFAKRPTRELWAGHPLTLPYLVLLLAGFAELPRSPGALVGSYPTVSPLPGRRHGLLSRRSVLCGTFLPVTGTGCYPAQCPVEFGLSSPRGFPRAATIRTTPTRRDLNKAADRHATTRATIQPRAVRRPDARRHHSRERHPLQR